MPRLAHAFKARELARQLGTRSAAGYLRNRGWSLDAALLILLNTSPRRR